MKPQVYTERDGLQASSVHLGRPNTNIMSTSMFPSICKCHNEKKKISECLHIDIYLFCNLYITMLFLNIGIFLPVAIAVGIT